MEELGVRRHGIAGLNERTGIDVARRDDAVERGIDALEALHLLHAPKVCLRGVECCLACCEIA